MTGILQEFFWTPLETLSWTKSIVSSFELWVVLEVPGTDAEIVDLDKVPLDIFYDRSEDSLHFFLGSNDISRSPVWREVHGRRLLDFPKSYAIQLAAPVVAPDRETLLEGRLAAFRANQYDDPRKAERLLALFRNLRTRLKKESDHERVVVQILSNGQKKRWKDIALGKGTPGPGIKRLKEFVRGEVIFEIEQT